jgi:D-alanyl-D-alanine carboxypeptidase (penicillin-binding protein 5/6)
MNRQTTRRLKQDGLWLAAIGLVMALGPLSMVSAQTARVPIPAPPQVSASSLILKDFDSGMTITERDADLRVEPASITKLMTSYVAFREIAAGNLSLDDEVVVSERAWRTIGSRMFVEVGNRVRVDDLLKGIIIQSGNDASVALAEHIAGNEEVFAAIMNQHAQRLGMRNTFYVNATGLPDEAQLTTARDSAILAQAIIAEFPEFYGWYSEREFTYNDIRQHNRNRLLWRDPSVDGLKTGHTNAAGYCLVTSARRDDMRLISVVMGTASEEARASASQALLNYGFRFFETYTVYQAGEIISTERVWGGRQQDVELGLLNPVALTLPRGRSDALQASIEIDDRLAAPIAAGQVVGQLVVRLDGEVQTQQPLHALSEVARAGLVGRTMDAVRLRVSQWFGGS